MALPLSVAAAGAAEAADVARTAHAADLAAQAAGITAVTQGLLHFFYTFSAVPAYSTQVVK